MSRAVLYCGDVRAVLATLPEASVQCVVTSPPYWGLRDYGTEAQVWGGDPGHTHEWAGQTYQNRGGKGGQGATSVRFGRSNVGGQERLTIHAGTCLKCGAWQGHLGLEPSPELYVEHIVAVFREVRRVLRPDGVCWLNLGDSYAHSLRQSPNKSGDKQNTNHGSIRKGFAPIAAGYKEKDLVGIPWRVAFALQADGWWLRSDVIWAKPNPMPESVTDRPTSAHEYVFLLTKSGRYYYDADAIAEPAGYAHEARWDPGSNGLGGADRKTGRSTRRFRKASGNLERDIPTDGDGRGIPSNHRSRGIPWENPGTRNARSVWTIPTEAYAGAHFATFPQELARRCIVAGSRTGDTVLDPFGGSGTTAAVAVGNGRNAVHIDLNPKNGELSLDRIGPAFCEAG